MATSSPEALAQPMIDNLPEKTGNSLQQWLILLAQPYLARHGEIVNHLTSAHEVALGYANLIAHYGIAGKEGSSNSTDLVDCQYRGPKADLRPINDAPILRVGAFGNGVDISPNRTSVSLRRNWRFALTQPSTRDRIDLGITLKRQKLNKRPALSRRFSGIISHRVLLTRMSTVNTAPQKWLCQAYEAA
jgi:hypothetical protein